eukprot:743849_1
MSTLSQPRLLKMLRLSRTTRDITRKHDRFNLAHRNKFSSINYQRPFGTYQFSQSQMSQCLASHRRHGFCSESSIKKGFGFREFVLIGSCVVTGYIVYRLYSDKSQSQQEQKVLSQYVLNKLFENETSRNYFFGDESDLDEKKKQQMELITANSKSSMESSDKTGNVWKLESDVTSNTGVTAHVTSSFKPLDRKTFKKLLNKYDLDENEKEEYIVLGRVVSMELDIGYQKTEQDDGTTVENYIEWKILDQQIVLFDVKNVHWEDIPINALEITQIQ